REWAYAFVYPNSEARNAQLPLWLNHYNFTRPHRALHDLPPASRLGFDVNNVLRNYT
ncbi:MAG: integrase core domain-containing protein, partial [Casimicrobiaceae bacterium]|nr:integrase core domain-containing protein [Casimicrobiaceae bacterium]